MDYKKTAEAIKLCGSTPKVDQCKRCVYWSGGDMSECIPRMTEDAATAITDLLSRAEDAEARAEKAEKCIDSIEDDLDRGNDNDWAREHIREYRTAKEE